MTHPIQGLGFRNNNPTNDVLPKKTAQSLSDFQEDFMIFYDMIEGLLATNGVSIATQADETTNNISEYTKTKTDCLDYCLKTGESASTSNKIIPGHTKTISEEWNEADSSLKKAQNKLQQLQAGLEGFTTIYDKGKDTIEKFLTALGDI